MVRNTQRDAGPARPLLQPVVRHPETVAHHRNDRVHARVVLVAIGLGRKRRGEGLLAAGAPQDPSVVDSGLDRRRGPELNVLVRGEVVELAFAARLWTWIASLQIGVRATHPFGARVVLGTEPSVTLLRTGGLAPLQAPFRAGLAHVFSIRALEIVSQELEQQGGRIRGSLPLRQPLFQAQELRLVDPHGLTPSRRRKSPVSG